MNQNYETLYDQLTYALNLSIDTIKELEALEKRVKTLDEKQAEKQEDLQTGQLSAVVKSIREKSISLNCTIDEVRSNVRRMEI